MSILVKNKKANFNYEILEKLSAGIELYGFEVKSLKNKRGSLEGAYVILEKGEIFLIKANITPYQTNNTPPEYDPTRKRKLLLTKKEIENLIGKEKQKGLTLIPLSLYNKNGLIKAEIALAKGKKKFDKREDIKRRDMQRDINRTLKEGN